MVHRSTMEIAATWLALGLDPETSLSFTANLTFPKFPS